jgi:hypothetical protein
MQISHNSPNKYKSNWDPIYTPFFADEVLILTGTETANLAKDYPQLEGTWFHPEDPLQRGRANNFWNLLEFRLRMSTGLTQIPSDREEVIEEFLDWLSAAIEDPNPYVTKLLPGHQFNPASCIEMIVASLELDPSIFSDTTCINCLNNDQMYHSIVETLVEETKTLLIRIETLLSA